MTCKKCGNKLEPGDKFCTTCGTKVDSNDMPMSFPVKEEPLEELTLEPAKTEDYANNMNPNHFPQPNLSSNQLLMNPVNEFQHPMLDNIPVLDNNKINNEPTINKNDQIIQMPNPPMNSLNNMNQQMNNNSMLNNMNNQMMNNDMNNMNQQMNNNQMMNNMNQQMNNNQMMNNDMNQQMNNNMNQQMNNMNNMNQQMNNNMNNNMNQQMNNMNNMNQQMNNNQMMNNNQQNRYNQQSPRRSKSNKNNNIDYKKLAIILGVIIAVLITIGFAFVVKNMKKNTEEQEMLDPIVKPYNVEINGFNIKVPTNYIYEISNGRLLVKDESDSWVIRMSFKTSNYDALKKRRISLKQQLESSGCITEGAVIETISGKEIIKLNYELSGQKFNAGYVKINSMYLVTIEAFNQENTYDSKLLKRAVDMIKTVTYTGKSNKMNSTSLMDVIENILN